MHVYVNVNAYVCVITLESESEYFGIFITFVGKTSALSFHQGVLSSRKQSQVFVYIFDAAPLPTFDSKHLTNAEKLAIPIHLAGERVTNTTASTHNTRNINNSDNNNINENN